MLIVGINVNDERIGTFYIKNMGPAQNSTRRDERLYHYRYVEPLEEDIHGEVRHFRNDLALELVKKCINDIQTNQSAAREPHIRSAP